MKNVINSQSYALKSCIISPKGLITIHAHLIGDFISENSKINNQQTESNILCNCSDELEMSLN